MKASNYFEDIAASDTEYFVLPELPDRIEITKAQISGKAGKIPPEWTEFREKMLDLEFGSLGNVANTFEELEPEYVRHYAQVKGKKVWCIGPVSLCNEDELDKAQRGKRASVDEHECLQWLGSRELGSVVYVCLGSMSRLAAAQLVELGLRLEGSGRSFVWVVRNVSDEFERWLGDEKFEEKVKGRGLLIREWAPQVLILDHPSVEGFLTHCGWNSMLEGVVAGLPCESGFLVPNEKSGGGAAGKGTLSAMEYLTNILSSKVYDVAVESPLQLAAKLSERWGVNVWLKREDFQPVFSFKLRGAYNMMAKLPREQLERGVICSSAGNHAQGVALSAQKLGCNAVIVMPVTTPEIKWRSVERLGATVVLFGDSYDEAQFYAKKRAEEEGRTFIPPFDHPDVITGQGTVGMEIVRQMKGPIEAIFVPVGGGGLIAGIAAYVKRMEVESSISSDPSLTNDSDLDQVQRNAKINEHFCTAVGGVGKKQRLYGVGSFGASQILAGKLSRISDVDIARIREEGRAEGRAEVQQILDEYKGEVQQKFDDMDKRFELMMARINTSESTPSGCS
ncbi:Threonine dehydratase biosynthetic-chloroplastic [Striga hermonthica]|uniref:Threonine dehydratase biosynthetic-chloroplastic n=1 Tax=Striga hermonthica TaxID=68872 RepID=A0A9N7NGU5_STRHE|nr:Threonine dehydratase biosynthetic-chloroplastic [Striga hermonthica]